MVTKIDGTTGVDRHQDGSVLQADLASGIAGNGPLLLAAGPVTNMSSGVFVKFSEMAPSVDLGSGWDATNLRYSPKVAGWYLVAAEAQFLRLRIWCMVRFKYLRMVPLLCLADLQAMLPTTHLHNVWAWFI